MKIRNGFVSNSSSSSFVIYGARISEYKAQALVKAILNKDVLVEIRTEEEKINGCIHIFDRDDCDFCPKCGAKKWKVFKESTVVKTDFRDFSNAFEKKTGVKIIGSLENQNWEADTKDYHYYLGEWILSDTGESDVTLEQLLKIRENVKKIDEKLNPKIIYEYSSE